MISDHWLILKNKKGKTYKVQNAPCKLIFMHGLMFSPNFESSREDVWLITGLSLKK